MKNTVTDRMYREWNLLPAVLTTAQAAILLQIHPECCARLCKNNELPCFKVGRLYRIRKEQLKQYIESMGG